MRSLCLLPTANPIGVWPLRVTCVFLTVAALRINWARVICDRVVLSKFYGGCIHECREKFLEQSDTHLSSFWPRSVWSSRKSLHIRCSIEFLHIMRMLESHACTDCLRIHLERIHPLMKFGDDCVECGVAPSKTIRNPKIGSPIFVEP